MSSNQKLRNILDFFHTSEKLKTLLRHSWLSNGRQESVAEHTWRMALMAIVLSKQLEEPIDLGHVLEIIIVHDLAEALAGDHHAWKGKLDNKHVLEREALHKLLSSLEENLAQEILTLWDEFEQGESPEAKFAQAMDKLEVLIQHNEADLSTWNEKEMSFNLIYGDDRVTFSPVLTKFRDLIRDESLKKLKKKI